MNMSAKNTSPNMEKAKTPALCQDIGERIKNFGELESDYTPKEAVTEANRCLNCPARYCSTSCPIHNNIPESNAKIRDGDFEGAYRLIHAVNPLPDICGRICPQEKQCERNCTRGIKGEPVAIGRLERFVAGRYRGHASIKSMPERSSLTGKSVAVIGSGPAGLSAAERLVRNGHSVTVFERSDRIGGLMVYGIPNMKLGKDILKIKADELAACGVSFITGTDVGKSRDAEELLREFDAVVLCCGASQPRSLNVPGIGANGVYHAVDFLRENTKSLLDTGFKGESPVCAKGKDVIVIGGGDTGNDCVATAIRHGCKSVVQLEMMPRETDERIKNIPWMEFPVVRKTDYGQAEAVHLYGQDPRRFQTTVKELIADNDGNLSAAKIVRLKTVFENLRMKMTEEPDSEEVLDCQMLLIAAGFIGSEEYVAEAFGVELDSSANIKTENGHRTAKEKVFTAGDMRHGQSVVVLAIEDGLNAAEEVDKFLMGVTD